MKKHAQLIVESAPLKKPPNPKPMATISTDSIAARVKYNR
jgi:hypothetical protein